MSVCHEVRYINNKLFNILKSAFTNILHWTFCGKGSVSGSDKILN